jgi:hypothetical protein
MKWRRSLSEHKWLILLGAIALLWANLPYMVGYSAGDSLHVFSGFFVFEQDGFSYLAKMRQGAQGNWLFKLPYTTEPHQGAFLYVFYLVAGKLSHILGMTNIAIYHSSRLLGSLLLLTVGAKFVIHFADTRRWRLLSWFLILFGGGAGWLISMFNAQYISYASVAPDAFVYSVLFGPPHVIIALALLLWTLLRISRLFSLSKANSRPRIALLAAVGGLGVALSRPEYVPILLFVAGTYWLTLYWRDRRLHLAEFCWTAVAALPGLSYAAYVFYVSHANPAIAAWAAQNPFRSPSLPNLLTGIGLLLVPAVLGMMGRPHDRSISRIAWFQSRDRLLVTSWLLVLPLLLYLPLSLNRRLIGGAQFAMALVAGYWIDRHLIPWLSALAVRRTAAGPVLVLAAMLLFSYPFLFGLGATSLVSSRPESLFLSADESAALEWLADRGGRPIVLADETTGNHIPAYSDAIPVLGHPIETLAYEQKRSAIEQFFGPGADWNARKAILKQYGVDLVWWKSARQAVSGTGLTEMSVAYRRGAITILSVPSDQRLISGIR